MAPHTCGLRFRTEVWHQVWVCMRAVTNVICDWPCVQRFSIFMLYTNRTKIMFSYLLNFHYLEMYPSFSYFYLFCCPLLHWSLPPLYYCSLSAPFCKAEVQGRLSVPKSLCSEVANLFPVGQGKTAKERRIHAVLNIYLVVKQQSSYRCDLLKFSSFPWCPRHFGLLKFTKWTYLWIYLKCPTTDGSHIFYFLLNNE